MTAAERLIRDDMTELMRLPSFHRFLQRWLTTAVIDTVGKGADNRSLEFKEGGRAIIMAQLVEAGADQPLNATLIQILSAAEQTTRKEIARGGSRDLDDGDDDGDERG